MAKRPVTRFTGADKMMANLKKLEAFSPDEFARALYQEAEIESKECKRRCPVDTRALSGSIHVEGPTREGRKISCAIVAGGFDKSGTVIDYGLIVHEDLEAFHANGEAKFIERPLNESAPHLAGRIAKRIDLNKAL